jgi:drug/metabolite transporter superfamily protein YnfA
MEATPARLAIGALSQRTGCHVETILWGWAVDRLAPDRFDVIGAAICLAGVAVIMYWPR